MNHNIIDFSSDKKAFSRSSNMKVNDTRVKKSCSLLACLRHAMRIVRWSGYFPVHGLYQLTADGTKFKAKSFYGIYNVFTLTGQVIMLCFSVHFFFNNEVTVLSASNVMMYLTNLLMAISLVRLAKCWPALMKVAEETERSLTILELDNNTIKKSNVFAYGIAIISLVSHILFMNFSLKLTMECLSKTRFTDFNEENVQMYVNFTMYFIFNYISYSTFTAALGIIFNFQTTFMRSYIDVLTICFSIYISSYFDNLNKIIRSKNNDSTISWSELREHYSKLARLVKEIDAQLSSFVLLSFFCDMYYTCAQLFILLRSSRLFYNNRSAVNIKGCKAEMSNNILATPDFILSYYTSFVFVITRFVLLSLFGANVHNTAQKPIIPVYSVQPEEYDQEVLRFQLILRYTTVAFSGKFFYVTRNTILQVISTIVTYELVLLQFNKTYTEDDVANNTTTTTF